ncbi:MAG: DUF1559 domain-containing protein [Capsulimonadaceae bacterium]|nr:DUF1559 domain-containing protein [Capsulimonadaceae bacterium]
MNKAKAFTLIELLVVIAIIAILAAILFPVFATAREKARATTCASNEKQLGIAFVQYAQDFDETYPCNGLNGAYVGWDSLISPYVGLKATYTQSNGTPLPTSSFFQCPDDVLAHYNNAGGQYQANAVGRTYAEAATGGDGGFAHACWNPYTTGVCSIAVPGGYVLPGRQTSEIPSPAATFMLVEQPNMSNLLGSSGGSWCFGPFNALNTATSGINATAGTQDCAGHFTGTLSSSCTVAGDLHAPLHSGGWNYLYVDGHVKWQNPAQTFGKPGTGPTGHSLNGYNTGTWCNGTSAAPCGPWTLDDNDN